MRRRRPADAVRRWRPWGSHHLSVLAAAAVALVLPVLSGAQQGIPNREFEPTRFHPLEEEPAVSNPLWDTTVGILSVKSPIFVDTVEIDFEQRQITFTRRHGATGVPVWQYHYAELEDYLESRQRFTLFNGWHETVRPKLNAEDDKKRRFAPVLVAPVHYPAWARRVLGEEPPSLKISGFQEIMISYISSSVQQEGYDKRDAKPGMQFNQNNHFTILGSVGRLVKIEIEAGSDQEEGFGEQISDQLKNFKIEYKGQGDELEDEVVQEVTAGYTNFQMPGTALTGYSGSHEGLFGIKVRSQIGPLSLTTIASHEQGKTEKKELDLSSGGGGGGWTPRTEKDFARHRFYWLDSIYLRKYLHPATSAPEVEELKIYRLEEYSRTPEAGEVFVKARYGDVDNPTLPFKLLRDNEDYYVDRKSGYVCFFAKARVQQATVVGIYMRSRGGAIEKGDTTFAQPDPIMRNLWVLKMDDNDARPTDSTFNLMWRNVYELPDNVDPDDFTMEVKRILSDSTREERPEGAEADRFVTILGVADDNGVLYDRQTDIFDFGVEHGGLYDRGYLILPLVENDTLGHREWPFANPDLGTSRGESNFGSKIYDEWRSTEWNNLGAIFEFRMKGGSSSQRSEHNLGWGITANSERLEIPGGIVLVPNHDYKLDYMTGRLELLSPRALSATRISVDYQQESMFVFEKRGFVGIHGKVDMPFIGRNSYFGTSLMYQNATARERIPKLGQEPFSRFMFGANTEINFEPDWMTKAVNALPLIKSDAASSAQLKLEIAGSIMDPTAGDEAYLDDFEASAQSLGLGEAHSGWYRASPPHDDSTLNATPGATIADDLEYVRPPAWHWYWYQPVDKERTLYESIWRRPAGTKINEQTERYASTMRLVIDPLPRDSALREGILDATRKPLVNPWAGIMTPVPLGLKDRSDDKYFEFWMNQSQLRGGVLYIDIGEISDDLSLDGRGPNKRPDTERINDNYNYQDKARDMGLDSLWDRDEVYYYPRYSGTAWSWDTLAYPYDENQNLIRQAAHMEDERKLGEFAADPARDNWGRYNRTNLFNKTRANGTQGDEGRLSSEDLGNDGFNLRRNNFYRVKVDLSDARRSPYFDDQSNAADSSTWKHFRVPIKSGDWARIGEPDWRNVRTVRLWVGDFLDTARTTPFTLEFTQIQFVGNQWRQVDTTDTAKIEAASRNTEDDDKTYATPPRIRMQIDADNEGTPRREQALSLKYRKVVPGEVALVSRTYTYENINLSAYQTLGMYVRAQHSRVETKVTTRRVVDTSGVDTVTLSDTARTTVYGAMDPQTWLVLRFGNNDTAYYEYRIANLYANPAEPRNWQDLRVDLRDFSGLKDAYLTVHGEKIDSVDTSMTLDDGSVVRLYSSTASMPTFSNIRWMALGVMRDSASTTPDSGEIWLEGIRITGLQARKGMAFIGSMSTQWADFMTLSGNVSYRNADFRTMAEEYLTDKPSSLSGGLSASWTLDKFLPSELGISIPFGVNVSSELSRPQIRPGSDIYLTDPETGEPDGLPEMGKDFASMVLGRDMGGGTTESEHWETRSASRSWNASYGKNGKGENPITRLTADRIDVSYRYALDTSMTAKGERANGEDHEEIRSRRTRNGSLKYDFSPRDAPAWTAWEPFKESKAKLLPDQMKRYKLSYLPSTIQFDLLDATYTTTFDTSTITERGEENEDLGLNHGFQFKYTPWSPVLNLDYNMSMGRDLKRALQDWRAQEEHYGKVPIRSGFLRDAVFAMDPVWNDYTVTFGERSRSQRAGIDFTPQFLDWLTHNFDYSATADQRLAQRGRGDSTSYMNVGVNGTFDFNSDFRIRTLLSGLSDLTKEREGLSGAFSSVDKALGKIEMSSFTFSYGAQSGLKNNYLSTGYLGEEDIGSPQFWWYKLGFLNRDLSDVATGDYDDQKAFGGMRTRHDTLGLGDNDTRTGSQNWSVNTRMRVPDPIDLSLNTIKLGWKRSYTRVPAEPYFRDSTRTFPELTLGASSGILEKMPFVKASMQNLDLSSTYTFTKSEERRPGSAGAGIETDTTRNHNWSPLVGLRGTVKKVPINLSYRYNRERGESNSTSGAKKRTTKGDGNTWDASYTVTPSGTPKEINLFNRWVVPIKGEFRTGVEASYNHNVTEVEDSPSEGTKNFSLHPHMSYDFTDQVRGTMEYTYRWDKNEALKDENENHNFTLSVRINF